MKTALVSRALTPSMVFIVWLLLPHACEAFYNPSTGRWLSRDPMDETGGTGLYNFVGNSAVDAVDSHGLCECCECAVMITIDKVVPYELHPRYKLPASYFEFSISLDYLRTDKPGLATFQWWENMNYFPKDYVGSKPGEWFNVFRVHPLPGNWIKRNRSCEPEVARRVQYGDEPYISWDKPKRIAHIKPTLINPPCCPKEYPRLVELTVVQTIDPKATPPATLQTPDPAPPPMPPGIR